MIKLLFFLCSASMALLLMESCRSIDGSVVVEGIVTSQNGSPLSNMKVRLTYNSTYTDNNGYFCFDGMHPKSEIFISILDKSYKNFKQTLSHGNYEVKIQLVEQSSSFAGTIESKLLPQNVTSNGYCSEKAINN